MEKYEKPVVITQQATVHSSPAELAGVAGFLVGLFGPDHNQLTEKGSLQEIKTRVKKFDCKN